MDDTFILTCGIICLPVKLPLMSDDVTVPFTNIPLVLLVIDAEVLELSKLIKIGYIYLVSLESVENPSALAALTFVDISGALTRAAASIAFFILLAMKAKSVLQRLPINRLRLISGILLAITATPLVVYSSGIIASLTVDNSTTPLTKMVDNWDCDDD